MSVPHVPNVPFVLLGHVSHGTPNRRKRANLYIFQVSHGTCLRGVPWDT